MISDNIIIQVIIYFTLITLIHYLYRFFKDTLTIPKVKDLVNTPRNDYAKMYASFNKENIEDPEPQEANTTEMKDELKSFFKSLNTDAVIPDDNIQEAQNVTQTTTFAGSNNGIASVNSFNYNDELSYSSY